MSNPIAVPGSVVQSGAFVTPGGAQGVQGLTGTQGPSGPSVVSSDAGNTAVLGSDSKILVPDSTPTITAVRLRSFNAVGNPTFEVDQRNVGQGVTNIANGAFILDRWYLGKSTTGTMTVNGQQVVGGMVAPGTNFAITNNALFLQLTAQQTTLAATDYLSITQTVEGPQWRELSNDVTSFTLIAYCSVALKFGLAIRSQDATRSLTKLCSIPAAAWTTIQLPNLPKPSGGNFSLLPGVIGYTVIISLACGSTYIAPANDVWQNGNFIGALGQDNFAAKPVNTTFYCAFIQHEPGSQCTQLIDCPFTQNLDACLRYFQKSYDYAVKPATSGAAGNQAFFPLQSGTTSWIGGHLKFPKLLAKDPTVTIYANDGTVNAVTVFGGANTGINSANTGSNQNGIISMNLSTAQANAAYQFHYSADTGW